MDVLFRLVCSKIEGTGLDGFCFIYQGHLFFQKDTYVRTTMSAQHVASVIWAAGKLSQAGDDALLSVLPMVALRAEEVRSDMKRREVANMRWALERLPDHAGIADAVASLRQVL